MVEGTTKGAVTDINGNFSLCGLPPDKKVILIYTYTGYSNK